MRKLLLISLVTSFASSQSCKTTPFIACTNNLAESVGMNSSLAQNLFKDYTLMYDWFLYQWGLNPGNISGMLRVCNGLEQFNGCIAGNKACLDVQNLVENTDINNAFFIDGTLAMYTFNCGPGINIIILFFNGSYLDTHHRIEGNTHLFKIPNYKDLVNGEIITVEGQWMKD
uniref:Hce2 domain-containing protein n=1 Tax=Heterorhabditis bacteriophora TaxID=37862 RepID=A0A1I7WCV0_HETBA